MNFKTAACGAVTFLILFFANLSLNAQSDSLYRLPAGTRLTLKMDLELSSNAASVNDTFTATVAKPVVVRDVVVLPKGTIVRGRVSEVLPSGRGGTNGKLDVAFESFRVFNSSPQLIDAELVKKLRPRSPGLINALAVVGGTVIGAVVGIIARVPAAGMGAGAGSGTAIAILRKGKELKIREDEEFEIELKKDLVLPVLDH